MLQLVNVIIEVEVVPVFGHICSRKKADSINTPTPRKLELAVEHRSLFELANANE